MRRTVAVGVLAGLLGATVAAASMTRFRGDGQQWVYGNRIDAVCDSGTGHLLYVVRSGPAVPDPNAWDQVLPDGGPVAVSVVLNGCAPATDDDSISRDLGETEGRRRR